MRLFILFTVIGLLFSSVSNAVSIPLGDAAPDFTLTSLKGDSVSLSEHKGSVVVLIYWRTEHKRSLQALQDVSDIINSRKKKDVLVFSIIAGSDDKDKARTIMSDQKLQIPVVVDSSRQLYSDYGIRVYPTTLVIDKEGVLVKDLPSHAFSYKKTLRGYIGIALGEVDEAGLEKMIDTHTEKTDPATLEAERLYNLATKFTKTGLLDMALNSARKSVEVKPDMGKAHTLLGFLYIETEEADAALESFSKAVELDPSSKEAQTGLGGALVMKGEADRAIEILKPATKANPYPQMTYYELGKAYELKGDKDKSSYMYKKAIEKIIHKMILPSSIAKCQ